MSGEDAGGEVLYGVHPVLEALETRRRKIERVVVAREGGGRVGRVARLAREASIPVSYVPRRVLERRAGPGVSHQGVLAMVSAVAYAEIETLLDRVASVEDAVLVALDGLQDPRNLGAILRTAAAAGASGAIVSAEGSAGLTPTVAKASAGAVERVPVVRESRLAVRLEALGALGFRAVGLDPRGDTPWDRADLTGRIIIVAGGEERGLRGRVLDACALRVSVPMAPEMPSLNVAVAVGVVLFEAVRQRRGGGGPGAPGGQGP